MIQFDGENEIPALGPGFNKKIKDNYRSSLRIKEITSLHHLRMLIAGDYISRCFTQHTGPGGVKEITALHEIAVQNFASIKRFARASIRTRAHTHTHTFGQILAGTGLVTPVHPDLSGQHCKRNLVLENLILGANCPL